MKAHSTFTLVKKITQRFVFCFGMGLSTSVVAAEDIRIGFIVKQPEEPWFQDEWRFADLAAKEKGFTLIKIGAEDGEKVISAIDNLGAQGAQGFILCTPDVKLGPALVARAEANDLKIMTVDDRLVDGQNQPLEKVPHMGISASKIGEQVGEALMAEIHKRQWKLEEVGALRIAYDALPTAVDRTNGAVSILLQQGFPQTQIFDAPQARTDTEAALNAATIVLNKNPQIKYWVAFGLNDESVLGAVRAAESANISADNMIGIGIGGSDSAINEFKKDKSTGFFGSVIISPKRHGYETSLNMYNWIAHDQTPELLILTSGELATRENYQSIRESLGL